jgi:hypothetical protein
VKPAAETVNSPYVEPARIVGAQNSVTVIIVEIFVVIFHSVSQLPDGGLYFVHMMTTLLAAEFVRRLLHFVASVLIVPYVEYFQVVQHKIVHDETVASPDHLADVMLQTD